MSETPLLSIEDVVVRFPVPRTLVDRLTRRPVRAVHALNGVRLDLRRGETPGLVGESGCGKSTLARLGLAVLFVAHDLRLVRHVSHRVAVMYLGSVVEVGPTEALFGAPRHPLHARPARRRPRPRPRAPLEGAGRARRIAEPAGAAPGLPLPHALPAQLRPLPNGTAGPRAARPRTRRRLPPRRR